MCKVQSSQSVSPSTLPLAVRCLVPFVTAKASTCVAKIATLEPDHHLGTNSNESRVDIDKDGGPVSNFYQCQLRFLKTSADLNCNAKPILTNRLMCSQWQNELEPRPFVARAALSNQGQRPQFSASIPRADNISPPDATAAAAADPRRRRSPVARSTRLGSAPRDSPAF